MYNEGDCTHKYHATKTCKRCGTEEDIIGDYVDKHDWVTAETMRVNEEGDWWWYERTYCSRCNVDKEAKKPLRAATNEDIDRYYGN